MKRLSTRILAILVTSVITVSGCDAADIVFASLDLAGAIIGAVD